MKIFELTTGLIAAVAIALGANYYVHKNVPVEKEPVETKSVQTSSWFIYGAGSPSDEQEAMTAENYLPLGSGDINLLCDGLEAICAINIPPQAAPNQHLPDFSSVNATDVISEIEKFYDNQSQDPVDEDLIRLKPE